MDNVTNNIALHVAEILKLLGLDAETDPELGRTPERVAQLYVELFQAVGQPPPDIGPLSVVRRPLSVVEEPVAATTSLTTDHGPRATGQSDMILVRGLPFYSLCIHHLLPFFGQASVAYVPQAKLAGFSGLARVLRHMGSQPQLQERMTSAVADHLQAVLEPEGIIVHLQARHLCLEMRGERVPGWVETTASRGVFQSGRLREEFFARIKGA
jgi:GTP cyclohydrolase I